MICTRCKVDKPLARFSLRKGGDPAGDYRMPCDPASLDAAAAYLRRWAAHTRSPGLPPAVSSVR